MTPEFTKDNLLLSATFALVIVHPTFPVAITFLGALAFSALTAHRETKKSDLAKTINSLTGKLDSLSLDLEANKTSIASLKSDISALKLNSGVTREHAKPFTGSLRG